MKKKAIISAIIIILILISVLPLPQKIEKNYYGYDTISGETVDVSLNMKHLRFLLFKDKMSGEIRVTNGDEVTVYYDGNIAESYPMQINKVYAVLLKEPADRSVNDQP